MAEEKNDIEQLEDVPDLEAAAEGEEDKTDWKAEALKYQGIAKRNSTRATKFKTLYEETKKAAPPKNEQQQPPKKEEKTEFDYGELAYLKASQVPEEDIDYLFQEAQATGKSLRNLLGFNYVKEELKNRAEARATKEATPSGSKRTGQAASNTPDFWLAKIEAGKAKLSDIPERSLRQKVVNLRIERERAKSQFTDNPIT